MSYSEKTGEVLCNPIGEFSEEDGNALLSMSGEDGMFRRVEEAITGKTTVKQVLSHVPIANKMPTNESIYCECGCGQVVEIGKRFIRYHHLKKKIVTVPA